MWRLRLSPPCWRFLRFFSVHGANECRAIRNGSFEARTTAAHLPCEFASGRTEYRTCLHELVRRVAAQQLVNSLAVQLLHARDHCMHFIPAAPCFRQRTEHPMQGEHGVVYGVQVIAFQRNLLAMQDTREVVEQTSLATI